MNRKREAEIVDAINAAVEAIEELRESVLEMKYRVTYVMERIPVKRPHAPGAIVAPGQQEFRTGTLAQFWMEDRESYIAQLKAEADALADHIQRQAESIAARRAAVQAELADRRRSAVTGIEVAESQSRREDDEAERRAG